MRNFLIISCLIFFITSASITAQQRKVLVEMFTNSHCPLCPPAHTALESYIHNDTNSVHADFIFYHMAYPYSDDQLYQDDKTDSQARDSYYGPFGATPDGFIDGASQIHDYNNWGIYIDNKIKVSSPFTITLSGEKQNGGFSVTAKIKAFKNVNVTDLKLHFVVIENTTYTGRNGVQNQPFVMRKMLPNPEGMAFSLDSGMVTEFSQNITLNNIWVPDSLSVVVFIQGKSSKEVYQSESMSYLSLMPTMTGIENQTTGPYSFILNQNYPNPFNPTTSISYSIPERDFVMLNVYDLVGNKVAELINKEESAGNHKVRFYADNLTSGIYFYQLRTSQGILTKKMILLK